MDFPMDFPMVFYVLMTSISSIVWCEIIAVGHRGYQEQNTTCINLPIVSGNSNKKHITPSKVFTMCSGSGHMDTWGIFIFQQSADLSRTKDAPLSTSAKPVPQLLRSFAGRKPRENPVTADTWCICNRSTKMPQNMAQSNCGRSSLALPHISISSWRMFSHRLKSCMIFVAVFIAWKQPNNQRAASGITIQYLRSPYQPISAERWANDGK